VETRLKLSSESNDDIWVSIPIEVGDCHLLWIRSAVVSHWVLKSSISQSNKNTDDSLSTMRNDNIEFAVFVEITNGQCVWATAIAQVVRRRFLERRVSSTDENEQAVLLLSDQSQIGLAISTEVTHAEAT
jgi:hypothetical protein